MEIAAAAARRRRRVQFGSLLSVRNPSRNAPHVRTAETREQPTLGAYLVLEQGLVFPNEINVHVRFSHSSILYLVSNALLMTSSGARTMLRRFRGLYQGRHISFGNQVSHAENKTRRSWRPNVHRKTFYSRVLGEWLQFTVTSRALRSIQKVGGIDEYLILARERDLLNPDAKSLRSAIVERLQVLGREEGGDNR
ncbi:39S ribosomal protein L24, mitochondrial [Cyanidiococcus yangmingshanensis]|uniref:Large ribosomal subunit protein bL28m n=1 Tax=Cyanidiococcus yangmingshanensis TaxID=2690220 RepID=A0A7J7INS7_9RHOD|nr:39S ribosomal protein L24, mitochondrial [Cyanidiococcus yangmingshanensis]